MSARLRIAALVALAALAACSHSPPATPAGFTRVNKTTWVRGSGAAQQRYVVNTTPFLGSMKLLVSQATMNVVLKHPGARFLSSVPIADCPAMAGIATYRLPNAILEEAFSVQDGNAITIDYTRPLDKPADPSVLTAMAHELCRAPGL